MGTIGNGLVIFITGFRMKVHTVWILCLAVADFTFSFFLLFHVVYRGLGYHWPFGYVMCKLKDTITFFNLYVSIYLLAVISIDRCISVYCPVWAQNHRTPRLASRVVWGICILALVLCSPYLYFTETYYDANKNKTNCSSSYLKKDEDVSVYWVVVLTRFIFGFIIHFSIIVVCYRAIVVRLRKDQWTQSSRPFKIITTVIVALPCIPQ
ncbi:chemerin-like receptor 1 [Tiliqua scincoides]|uniref:chemerin-like receptor 1 n=1 Tax=Tiliqua scincoides TaxID=71010 RepID=UPI003463429A